MADASGRDRHSAPAIGDRAEARRRVLDHGVVPSSVTYPGWSPHLRRRFIDSELGLLRRPAPYCCRKIADAGDREDGDGA